MCYAPAPQAVRPEAVRTVTVAKSSSQRPPVIDTRAAVRGALTHARRGENQKHACREVETETVLQFGWLRQWATQARTSATTGSSCPGWTWRPNLTSVMQSKTDSEDR